MLEFERVKDDNFASRGNYISNNVIVSINPFLRRKCSRPGANFKSEEAQK